MPYIAFELDALNAAPLVARAAGVSEDTIIAGQLRMWAHCFRMKKAVISTTHVRGFFGADLTLPLSEFGFLEAHADGWRVKGAERYLRIKAAQSQAGKTAKTNLRQFTGSPTGSPPGLPGAQPEVDPELSSGSPPALSPNTEHRTPTTSLREWVKNTGPSVPPGAQFFFDRCQELRKEAGLERERPPPPRKLKEFWDDVVAHFGEDNTHRIWEAHKKFGGDKYWRKKSPPFPIAGFLAMWRDYL